MREEAYRDMHIARLRRDYDDVAPAAGRFAAVLARELHLTTERLAIPLAVPIEHRVKSWSSCEDKLAREPFHGATLTELHDLVGVRLILLFRRDLTRACQLVEDTLHVCGQQDKSHQLKHDQFGYQSVHFIVTPPQRWLSVPSFAEFRHLQAEIQVRTLAQHMWAAASHVLQYKHEDAVPPPVRRAIHRVSALLETVDLEFERVLADRDRYRSDIDLVGDRRLNTDVLEALLDDLLPKENKEGLEHYSLLLWELQKLGIHSTEQLRVVIKKHLPKALEHDRKSATEVGEREPDSDRSRAGVFFSHVGLMRMIFEAEFGDDYYSLIWKKAEEEGDS